ncbi:tripartite tricarboxylate transporter TctB family protein [Paracoccus liaowanqingii]|uniref:Tripartite tricarboxylate transporter TctB family protein n=1 Tax=Paracoccus liaowanqingii TaxID=2560053 RepID=A0A4Z1CAX1_9RHOB|nr:tripartite tricarboxylate transporter TctB family protein [Paracoccus liaowanqingii]TGN56392.1 tripartite tricarboxylate transporter TctB family protein [Paracoccus liaowanqingii]
MNIEKPLGAALVAIGGAGAVIAMQISVRTFNNDPGPKLFPIMACTILVICGLGLLFKRGGEPAPTISGAEWRRGTVMAGLLVGYAAGLWLVGFYAATLIGSFAIYYVMAGRERRNILRGAIYAVLVTAVVHLVFRVALGAFLPRGILF